MLLIIKSKLKILITIKSQFNEDKPEFLHNCNVAKNVIAPASEEAPRKCKLKIANETADDVEKSAPDNG